MGLFILLYKIQTVDTSSILVKGWQALTSIYMYPLKFSYSLPTIQNNCLSASAEKLFWGLKELLCANKAKADGISTVSSLVLTWFYRITQPVNREIRVSVYNVRKITKIARTQYKSRDIAGNLTQAHHKEEHCEDGPRRGEGHGTAEDTHHDDGTEQCRLPAKSEVQI